MMIPTRSLSRPAARPSGDVPSAAALPRAGEVLADIGLLLACHLAVATLVCLVLDLCVGR